MEESTDGGRAEGTNRTVVLQYKNSFIPEYLTAVKSLRLHCRVSGFAGLVLQFQDEYEQFERNGERSCYIKVTWQRGLRIGGLGWMPG